MNTTGPAPDSWSRFTDAQRRVLEQLRTIGNNNWTRTGQTDSLMPVWLGDAHDAGLSISEVVGAMRDCGASEPALHQLERWEHKRLHGTFGK